METLIVDSFIMTGHWDKIAVSDFLYNFRQLQLPSDGVVWRVLKQKGDEILNLGSSWSKGSLVFVSLIYDLLYKNYLCV